MNEDVYSETIAKNLLPENKNYHFENISLISALDENGEVKIDIVGRTDVSDVNGAKLFLENFYASSGSTFNVKSGRADRSGEHCSIRGYRKCMMQVCQKNVNKPRMKGRHQNCDAELNFRLDKPKVRGNPLIYYEFFLSNGIYFRLFYREILRR